MNDIFCINVFYCHNTFLGRGKIPNMLSTNLFCYFLQIYFSEMCISMDFGLTMISCTFAWDVSFQLKNEVQQIGLKWQLKQVEKWHFYCRLVYILNSMYMCWSNSMRFSIKCQCPSFLSFSNMDFVHSIHSAASIWVDKVSICITNQILLCCNSK